MKRPMPPGHQPNDLSKKPHFNTSRGAPERRRPNYIAYFYQASEVRVARTIFLFEFAAAPSREVRKFSSRVSALARGQSSSRSARRVTSAAQARR